MKIKQKKIAVLGLGISGMAAARLALRHCANVSVWDEAGSDCLEERAEQLRSQGASVELGVKSYPELKPDISVISPGVEPGSILGRFALEAGGEVLSELEFGWSFMEEVPLIAITGTNGKTTTAELCAFILNENGISTHASGNIGYPVSSLALEDKRYSVYVFEVSSFLLERIRIFCPNIAVLTIISPDHLERYPSEEEYLLTNLKIFSRQRAEDWALIQWDAAQLIYEKQKKLW